MSKMDNEKLDHLILETWTDFIDLKNKAELSEVFDSKQYATFVVW